MIDPGEMNDLLTDERLVARPFEPRTRDELVQLLIQLQFASDRLGTMARKALILAHSLVGDDSEDATMSVRALPWR